MPWTINSAVSDHYYNVRPRLGGPPSPGIRAFQDRRTWDAFQFSTSSYLDDATPFEPKYLFRGQSNATWTLEPSLLRSTGGGVSGSGMLSEEERLLREFDRERHLHWNGALPASRRESWALMQHHGVPTRLLDWTASLWVALYFAVVDNPEANGALFVVNARELEQIAQRKLGAPDRDGLLEALDAAMTEPDADPLIYPFPAEQSSQRSSAQQGYFTLCMNVGADHYQVIKSESKDAIRVPIPAQAKPPFLNELRMMGVNGQSLFPGPDGFGRSLREATAIRAFMHCRAAEERALIGMSEPVQDWQAEAQGWVALDKERERAEREQADFIRGLADRGASRAEIAGRLRLSARRVDQLMDYRSRTPFDDEIPLKREPFPLIVEVDGQKIAVPGGEIISG